MSSTNQKGINFKETPLKKLLLIHPNSFAHYLSTQRTTGSGKIIFEFIPFNKLTSRSLFAKIEPVEDLEDIEIANPRPINFIKQGNRTLVVIHKEGFNYFLAHREGWVPYKFKYLTNSETDFAEITPQKARVIQKPELKQAG